MNNNLKKKLPVILTIWITMLTSGYSTVDNKIRSVKDLNILPWPKQISLESDEIHLLSSEFSVSLTGKYNERIHDAITSFLIRIDNRTGIFLQNKNVGDKGAKSNLIITINRPGKLLLHEDESYALKITKAKIYLDAPTDLGALHGLETLLQLLNNNSTSYFFPSVKIKDSPRFAWRGLMIDVARHYQPVHIIKRNIAAMSSVKMNVFHWHLSDDQGFRVTIKKYPKLHALSSDGLYYTQEEIVDVVRFASKKGIRVIPEIDVPGHATAILTAYPELASKDTIYTLERKKGVFHATLDPTNKKTYEFLDHVISELSVLFPDVYFHIGGDENKGKHWNENKEIQKFKKNHDLKGNHELQTYFNIKLQEILKKNGKVMMGWDEIFQPNLPKDVIIHSWRGTNAMIRSAALGYQSILSKGYYIDLLLDTETHYKNDPIPLDHNLKPDQLKNILGGEATMWGELVNIKNIDSRIWPRTAAIAERFWSDSSVNDFNKLIPRLNAVSVSLEDHGITHISSRRRILRNLFPAMDIEPFVVLSKACSPMTAKERVGKYYRTFQPFTLFVDACTPDNPILLDFRRHVQSYITDKTNEAEVLRQLDQWRDHHVLIKKNSNHPIVKDIVTLSGALSEVSRLIAQKIRAKEKFNQQELKNINNKLIIANTPLQNVRIAIIKEFESLITTINKF